MNFTISHRQFAQLVRGQVVTLDEGGSTFRPPIQIALSDFGFPLMQYEVEAAAKDFSEKEAAGQKG